MKLFTTRLAFFMLFSLPEAVFAQFPGCPAVDAGSDQTLTCNQPCATLTATPFNAGATTSYNVSSIPHTPPIAYNEAGGTGVSVGTDDVWSPAISLPFNFCYFGVSYNTCTISSNGAIKFGTSYANNSVGYTNLGGVPSTSLTSRGDIFGVGHDIDPTVAGTVTWYVVGTAPCRIFVVSYNNLGHFSCTSMRSTHMMVLYETTNVIDVYIARKDVCTTWQSGYGIVGIQNPSGTVGYAAPGRNATPAWSVPSSSPEAWRFTPSGAPIYSVEWFQGATSLGTTNSISVCPTAATTYTAKATYTACDGTVIVTTDDVIVNPDPSAPSGSETANTPSSCTGSDGSTTIAGSGGAGSYTYSIDNGANFQASGTFSGLSPGTYTIQIKDVNGCIGSVNITISNNAAFDLVLGTISDVSCNAANDGSAVTSVTGGSSPITYTLNAGAPLSNGNFTALAAGSYTVVATDNNGCTDTETFTINEPTAVIGNFVTSSSASCSAANGQFEVSGSGGTGSLSYSMDNGANTQATGVFQNVSGGSYTVLITDANGCSTTVQASVNTINNLTAVLVSNTDVSCFGLQDAQAILNGVGTPGPYTFALVGGTFQSNNTFINLGVGTYNYVVQDASGCMDTVQVTIDQPTVLSAQNNGPFSICQNGSVSMTATASGGTSPYAFTWSNGLPNGATQVVTPTQTTTYIATITDNNGCVVTTNVQVNIIPPPAINAGSDQTICAGQTVVLSGSGGVTYNWSNGVVNGQAFSPGTTTTYTVTGTDANGCTNTDNITVTVLPLPQAGINATTPTTGYPGLTVTFANSSTNANAYSFDYDNGNTHNTTQVSETPSSTFNAPGIYTVVLTASNGYCSDTATTLVIINPYLPVSIVVPNIITPNGDHENDEFFIRLENAADLYVLIVNRWGEKVAEITDVNGKWDGTIKGNDASEGVYFFTYTVKGLDGSETEGQGFVELIRK